MSDGSVSREELYSAITALTQTVTNGFAGVNARLDTANGKLYRHEADIAVLKDRADQAKDGHARYAGWGGVVMSALAILWQLFTKRP